VFISTGHESDVVTSQTLVSGDGVSGDTAIGMSDMDITGSIINWSRDVKIFLFVISHMKASFNKALILYSFTGFFSLNFHKKRRKNFCFLPFQKYIGFLM
jgi:hypothetical protein